MHRFARLTATLPALFLLFSCGGPPGPVVEAPSFDEARRLAVENDDLIVIDFWHDGCPPCADFALAVEEDAGIRRALDGLVLVKIDTRNPEQNALADSHDVRMFPTFVMTDSHGEVLSRWIGYGDPEDWIATVAAIKDDPVTAAERAARHQSNPSFRDALALGRLSLARRECADAERFFRDALRLDPSKAKEADVPIRIFRAAYHGVGEEQIAVDHATRIASGLLQEPRLKPEYAFEVTERFVDAIDQVGEERVIPCLRMAYPHIVDLADAEFQERQNEFFINYAIYVEKNATQALRLKRAGLPEAWSEDPDALNSFAWWCFEHDLNLEEAEQVAARGVELATSEAARANVLDTQAEIVNALGRTQAAFALIERALELDPQSEYLQHQHERFNDLVNGSAEMP